MPFLFAVRDIVVRSVRPRVLGASGEVMADISAVGPLEPLRHDAVEEAARLAAAAFVDSPAYSYIFESLGDEQSRLEALAWLFRPNIRLRLDSDPGAARCAYAMTTAGRKEMVCFFMILPTDSKEIGALAMVANGILRFPLRFGFRPFARLLEVKARHDRLDRALHESRRSGGSAPPLRRLERVVVRPGWQGMGVGGRCLGEALAEADAFGHGVSLSTQEARNVAFYSRLGFVVVGDPAVLPAAAGRTCVNYQMAREPHPPTVNNPNQSPR